MKEITGYKKLAEAAYSCVYCPKCKNRLEVVDNGWFHGELFFCPKEEKVFCIQLKEITKKCGAEFISRSREKIELEDLKHKINYRNMKKIKEILNSLNE